MEPSDVINLERFMRNTLYAHSASIIHFVYNTCNILTLVIPVLSWHWLPHFCFFSVAEISVCLYVYRYCTVFFALM